MISALTRLTIRHRRGGRKKRGHRRNIDEPPATLFAEKPREILASLGPDLAWDAVRIEALRRPGDLLANP
jgi:hypothetical protein